jgi:hypothetical protein
MTETQKMAFLRSIATHVTCAQERVDTVREVVAHFPVTPEVYDRLADALESLGCADAQIQQARTHVLDAYAELTAFQLERDHTEKPEQPQGSDQDKDDSVPLTGTWTVPPELMLVVQGNDDEHGLAGFRRKILQGTSPAGNGREPLAPVLPKENHARHQYSACSDWPAAPYPPPLTEDQLLVYKDGRKLEGPERAAALASLAREDESAGQESPIS